MSSFASRAAALFLVLIAAIASSAAMAESPSDLVKQVYRVYFDTQTVQSPLETNRQYLSSGLKDLFDYYDTHVRPKGTGELDFDPYISAQDYAMKDFAITSEATSGESAVVEVEFMNYDYWVELRFRLVREAGAWKINDIESKNPDWPWILSTLLKPD